MFKNFIVPVLKRNIVPITLFLISVIIIWPYLKNGLIIYAGESTWSINPLFLNSFYLWNEGINLGQYFSSQSAIFLFFIFWKIFGIFSAWIHPSVIYIFLTFYLPGLFFYFLLNNIFDFDDKIIYLPACLLYSFNIYRIQVSYQNECVSLLFIFMPLFFLFYKKLLEKKEWKYVFILTLISISSSTMGDNLPVFIVPYFLLFIYLIFYLFTHKFLGTKKILLLNITLLLLVTACNLFWIVPQLKSLLQSYKVITENGTNIWNAIRAGSFFDHFRYMGFWAWKSGWGYGLYFPFSLNYDKPILLITTFFISILTLIYLFFLKREPYKNIKGFLAFLTIFSYFLLAGAKGSLGFIYKFLYENFMLFKIYREPWAKFMPLFIFATAISLVFSIFYFFKLFKRKIWKNIFIFFISFIILFNAYPLFTKEAIVFRRWNLGQVGNVLKVPEYWEEGVNYLSDFKLDEQIFLLPYNFYGNSHNFEYGINLVGNIADYLLKNKLVKGWQIDDSNSGKIIKILFDNTNNSNWQKYLGLLGIKRTFVENDVEWRYSGGKIFSPSNTEKLVNEQELNKVAEFGKFTKEYLDKILNEEPDEKLRNEFYQELTGRPALALYESDDKYFLQHFYTPKEVIFSDKGIEELINIVSEPSYETRSAVYFLKQSGNYVQKFFNEKDIIDTPVLEFEKINPTKYRVIVHNAKGNFPLIFSESYDEGWKIYLTKYNTYSAELSPKILDFNYKILDGNKEDQASKEELLELIKKGWVTTLGDLKEKELKHTEYEDGREKLDYIEKYKIDFISKDFQGTIQNDNLSDGYFFETWLPKINKSIIPISDQNHSMVNGYANSWIIETDKILAQPGFYKKNSNGSYDIEFIVEYRPQRFLYIGFGLSGAIIIGCLGYLVYVFIKTKKNKNNRI